MKKFTVLYMPTGMTMTAEIDRLFDGYTEEQFNDLPEYSYYTHTIRGYVKCTKDKHIIKEDGTIIISSPKC